MVVDEWIVDVISFQKIFGLCCLKCHIVEIWRDVTFEDGQRTDDGNVNIVLESAKQDSQLRSKLIESALHEVFIMSLTDFGGL